MSKSRSHSEANQTSLAQDQRVAASDNAIALSAGATLTQVDVSDTVAVAALEQTAGVAETAIEESTSAARAINADSLDFAGSVVDTASDLFTRQLETASDTQQTVADLAQGLSTLAITNLEKNKRDPDSDVIQTVAKYATTAAAVVAGVVVLALFFRNK